MSKKISELTSTTIPLGTDLLAKAKMSGVTETDTQNISYDNLANHVIETKIYSGLTTFNKNIQSGLNELNSYQEKVRKDTSYFLNAPATQTLTTSGAGDLATKIGTLIDGDILEIQVSASYSASTIPSGKRFAIRVAKGYEVELNNAQAITLSNGAADVFMSGFIFDSNPGGTHSQGSAVCFQHQAIVRDITFHNCTLRNSNHSAVLLSYHQSTGGDTYYTANLLSEFSDRIAFVKCHFDKAANDPTEGGAIAARGINNILIDNCSFNGQELSRCILLQNCRNSWLTNMPNIQRASGAGNGEGIKIDKIGSPTYRNSAFISDCRVKNCIEGIDIDDDADAVIIDCIVSGCSAEAISVDNNGTAIIINCTTYNNFDGIRQEAGATINLKGCNSFNNSNQNYRMDGGYVPDDSNISDPDQTFFNWVNFPVIQKEPTGFTGPANLIEHYDSSARNFTLTGTVNGYYRGVRVPELATGFVSAAHSAANGKYWLVYKDGSFQWVADGAQKFYDLLIGFAYYGVTDKWGQRECHGLMPWQSHEEDHDTIGTYLKSGGALGAYVLSSTTVADRQPSVSAAEIKDEDLTTLNPALTASGNYTQFFLSGSNTANFNKTATDIVPLSGNQPYWNEFTGGAWQQKLMSNNYYMSIWLIAVPTSSDSASQDYRYLWVQGQNESLTLLEQQGLDPNSVNLGELTNLTPEFVFISQIITRYQAADWTFSEVRAIDGTKFSQTSSPQGNYLSVVTSDTSLTGLGTVSSPLSVAGGSEDLWDRVGTVLSPHTAGDDVDLGSGNLSAYRALIDNLVSVSAGGASVSLLPEYIDLTVNGSVSNNVNVLQITNKAEAASMIGTETSFKFSQVANDLSAYDMSRITFGTATNWTNTASTRDGYFDFYLANKGIETKAYSIIPDPVFISQHLFRIEGNLEVNTNSARPVTIYNGGIPSDAIFMTVGGLIFSVTGSCNIDQNLASNVPAGPSFRKITLTDNTVVSGLSVLLPTLGLTQEAGIGTDIYNKFTVNNPGGAAISSAYDIELAIDADNNSALQEFRITKDAVPFSSGTLLFKVSEDGTTTTDNINLTNTAPTNGLTISLDFPTATKETGIGANLGNKFIYNNPEGIGIYSSHNIMLMLDSNSSSTTAEFGIYANSLSYAGGIKVFSVTENAQASLKIPSGGATSGARFTIDTTDANDQSMLELSKSGVNQWQLVSRNEIDTPNNRLSIYDSLAAGQNEVVTIIQGSSSVPGTVTINGNLALKVKTLNNASYTAQSETLFSCYTNTSTRVVSVPAAASGNAGRMYWLHNDSTSTFNYSFDAAGSPIYIATPGQTIFMFSDGGNWIGGVF